jgi:hypothetical protein
MDDTLRVKYRQQRRQLIAEIVTQKLYDSANVPVPSFSGYDAFATPLGYNEGEPKR